MSEDGTEADNERFAAWLNGHVSDGTFDPPSGDRARRARAPGAWDGYSDVEVSAGGGVFVVWATSEGGRRVEARGTGGVFYAPERLDRSVATLSDPATGEPLPQPTGFVDQEALLDLVRRGVLVGVEVFGTDQCCEHGEHVDCDSTGYGLCDRFTPHSVGSDCNRSAPFLLRPADGQMTDALRAAIAEGGS